MYLFLKQSGLISRYPTGHRAYHRRQCQLGFVGKGLGPFAGYSHMFAKEGAFAGGEVPLKYSHGSFVGIWLKMRGLFRPALPCKKCPFSLTDTQMLYTYHGEWPPWPAYGLCDTWVRLPVRSYSHVIEKAMLPDSIGFLSYILLKITQYCLKV
jgi:hypothetical protein